MNTKLNQLLPRIGVSVLIVLLAACAEYKPGGARNQDEILSHARHLRTDCELIGTGVEGQHGGGLVKSDIFKCPDGSIGFIPANLGR